ncbi:MAG: acetolactate synthase small subunit [Dehalococcoidales bacterium]|nr:acetolactate synthase small subunit [Dehalococcoidales bacterium]
MVSTKHTLVALVEDNPGVLNRMVSLFRRRSFNIASIAVGNSETPGFSRITFVVDGSITMVEQVRKQLLSKVVEVVKVSDITDEDIVIRELALIKVSAPAASRSEIIQIVDIFKADIVDVSQDTLTVEITGTEDKIESLLGLLRPFGIRELTRTGRIAMARGGSGTEDSLPAKTAAEVQPDE